MLFRIGGARQLVTRLIHLKTYGAQTGERAGDVGKSVCPSRGRVEWQLVEEKAALIHGVYEKQLGESAQVIGLRGGADELPPSADRHGILKDAKTRMRI